MAVFECIPRHSLVSISLYKRYFLFLIVHGFLTVTVSSGITSAIVPVSKMCSSTWISFTKTCILDSARASSSSSITLQQSTQRLHLLPDIYCGQRASWQCGGASTNWPISSSFSEEVLVWADSKAGFRNHIRYAKSMCYR